MNVICAHCSRSFEAANGAVSRARRSGKSLFCGRACFGLSRRLNLSAEDMAARKAAYDREYRKRDPLSLKEKKRSYFQRTYDPVRAAVERKKRMPAHVEYCRKPTYVEKKSQYDQKRRATLQYGPYADAFLTLIELEKEIAERATNYEIRQVNGTLNKTQERRRSYERLIRNNA